MLEKGQKVVHEGGGSGDVDGRGSGGRNCVKLR